MSNTDAPAARVSPLERIAPGIKIAAQISPEAAEHDLRFIRQMGVEHVVLWTDATKSSAEYYADRKATSRRTASSVYGFGNRDVHNQRCDRPRPARIATRRSRNTSATSARSAPPASPTPPMPTCRTASGAPSAEETRGGASARGFDEAKASIRPLARQRLHPAADQRARVQRGRGLGALHLLHPPGRARRGGRRAC